MTIQKPVKNTKLTIILVVCGSLLFLGLCEIFVTFSIVKQFFVYIEPTERGLVISPYTTSGYRSEILEPGLNAIKLGERVEIIDIGRQTMIMSCTSSDTPDFIEVKTSDNQTIQIDISVTYAVDPENIINIYINWQDRYSDLVRATSCRNSRNVMSNYTYEEILEKKDEIENNIFTISEPSLAKEGILLLEFEPLDIRQVPD